ncbi:MAG: ribosome biogenesis GTPase Der [Oligoflexia bacterium]|nr:ribosome biogenesis GTPase Der [Oligoflexia bacterium]
MKILIVGRTNVGKSSLFNRLVKKKKSLVINESRITRDLLKEKAHWWGHDFEVIDSGGLPSLWQKDKLSLKILEKINLALKTADVFVIVVSAKSALQPEDFEILKKVRKMNKPFLLFINKVDHPKKTDLLTAPFFELNPELLSGSIENNYGIDEIVEWIISQKKKLKLNLKTKTGEQTKLFVTGRANSGKSLLCNQILGSNRMIVSSKSGTTLDTVTEVFSYNEEHYMISDNPGSRRGNREEREKISYAKSRSELETADIVLLVLDVLLQPGRQETRLVQTCLEEHKPVILIVNKMDLLKKYPSDEKKEIQQKIKEIFHFYPDLPIVYISAKTAYHKGRLFKKIEELKKKINFKVSTSELNQFFSKVIRKAPAPVYGVSDVKFYYINQTNKKPPEFIAFANYPKGVTDSYKRFIINKIKQEWNLKGIPIAFHALPKR